MTHIHDGVDSIKASNEAAQKTLTQPQTTTLLLIPYLVRVEISPDEEMLEPQVSLRLFLLHDSHHLSLPQDRTSSVQLSKLNHFQHNLPKFITQ